MKTTLPQKSKSHEKSILTVRDKILAKYQDRIAFIILFGSFARGDWVYDYYTEDKTDYEYASDYDFLIIMKNSRKGMTDMLDQLEDKILVKYHQLFEHHTPSIITESLQTVNKDLEKGRYFYKEIKEEGILLYEAENYELAEEKELTPRQRKKEAEEDFDNWFEIGNSFLKTCKFNFQDEDYKTGAFQLHQSTESFYHCTLLVFSGYKPKFHNIKKLGRLAASYHEDFLKIFPKKTEEQRVCFELLKKAYIDSRFKRKAYKITKGQLEYLIQRVEKLREVVKKVCEEKINSFERC